MNIIGFKKLGSHLMLIILSICYLVILFPFQVCEAFQKQIDIAGLWESNINLEYKIFQNNNNFTWDVIGRNQKASGKINGLNVSASWQGQKGMSSASGIIHLDPLGRAIAIEWSNGVIFERDLPPAKSLQEGASNLETSANELESGIVPGKKENRNRIQPRRSQKQPLQPRWGRKIPSIDRFVLVMDGAAVLDMETELVWAKNAGMATFGGWYGAMEYCRDVNIGGRKGWRLPAVEELASLIDMSQRGNKLPAMHPFDNVHTRYKSSTRSVRSSTHTWSVNMKTGKVLIPKVQINDGGFVWCVRGGN